MYTCSEGIVLADQEECCFGNQCGKGGIGSASQLEQLGASGVAESSAERSRWLGTQKAEASLPASLPHFMYSSVCVGINTQVER